MKTAVILCEYNPLHMGHAYHIAQTRLWADRVICVMSGSFVQRGDLAMFDKFARARWALQAGADLVVELPCVFSLQSAEGFARGGVYLAEAMGADLLSFGAECADLQLFKQAANINLDPPEAYTQAFRACLDSGKPYAAAKAAGLRACGMSDMLLTANGTLGVEYTKQIIKNKYRVQPMAVSRRVGSISSSQCRAAIRQGHIPFVPGYVLASMPSPCRTEQLEQALLYRLRSMTMEEYRALPDLSEGLENRIYLAARQVHTWDSLARSIASSRYPLARIKRILCCALLGITAQDAAQQPHYIRILGMRRESASSLAALKEQAALPVADRPVTIKEDPQFIIEQRATDLRALLTGQPAGLDFTSPLIVL